MSGNAQPIADPIFLCLPTRVVGTPVDRATFVFSAVIPSARFMENETPGILYFPFLAI